MAYLTPWLLFNKITNIGAPITAVMTPMGISKGEKAVRLMVSHRTINVAAAKQEQGIRTLWFGPTINLIIWGMIKPTKPIIPEIETRLAVIKEVIKNNIFFVVSVLIPRCMASSSPMLIAFKSCENTYIAAMPDKTTILTIKRSLTS